MKISFSDIDRKWILPNMIRVGTALIIFGKIHFLLTSEIKFFMKENVTELQAYMEFMFIHCDQLSQIVALFLVPNISLIVLFYVGLEVFFIKMVHRDCISSNSIFTTECTFP